MTAAGTGPAADLARSALDVEAGARAALDTGTRDAAGRLRSARPAYSYGYAARIAATATSKPARSSRPDVFTASVRVGGRAAVFRGGASVSTLLWGAEFGAKGGDVVRVSYSTGARRTVAARNARAAFARAQSQHTVTYRTKRGQLRRRTVKAGTAGASRTRVVGVRAGGLPQFPARRVDGWFLTPALDELEAALWDDTERAFADALAGRA